MKLSDYIKALEDGKAVEIQDSHTGWTEEDCPENICNTYRRFGKDSIRIKPTLKPVDMSVLVGSGIDCTFGVDDPSQETLGQLKSIDAVSYVCNESRRWFYCKPRMDYWFSGKNCALKGNDLQIMLMEAGFSSTMSQYGEFSIRGLHPDRCWPWEAAD